MSGRYRTIRLDAKEIERVKHLAPGQSAFVRLPDGRRKRARIINNGQDAVISRRKKR